MAVTAQQKAEREAYSKEAVTSTITTFRKFLR